jgi:hypothetical protein
MATLNGAFALAQVNDVAVPITKHLDLDVAWARDEAFQEDRIITE